MYLTEREVAAISQLWSELADVPPSQHERGIAHALSALARIFGAANAFWAGATQDENTGPPFIRRVVQFPQRASSDYSEAEVLEIVKRIITEPGLSDYIVGVHAIDRGAVAYFGFERARGDPQFTERERDVLRLFLPGASAFHRNCVLPHRTQTPLTARERQVLRLLLMGMSERVIGAELTITPRTTHQYVVSILRKFNVHGRIELMAHFLRS